MHWKLIACEIFYRELCACVAGSPYRIDLEFLPKGLHDIGCEGMRERLQEAVDQTPVEGYDAILMGYGLCNHGVVGLAARSVPLVIPRGHDCITLFMGSRSRYLEYFQASPGTYFKTSGWIERGEDAGELRQLSISHKMGMDLTYEQLVERYGEDNAKYLQETLCDTRRNYSKIAYIEMGVEPDDRFERRAREEAERRGWEFERLEGDLSLLERLTSGRWSEDEFLVVPPGWVVAATHGDDIIRAVPREE